jgi:hypothetical protein
VFAAWLIWEKRARDAAWFALPVLALAVWLACLKTVTGHWMGNAEFTEYNLFYPLNPVRLTLSLLRRIYYLFIGSGHIFGTLVLVWAWRRMPLFRSRPWRVALAFVVANVLVVTALGGAVLERYLLPVLPIVYIAFGVALRALLPNPRKWALAALLTSLIVANFVNPLYPFPFENNLAFVDFVELEREGASAVELHPGVVATTFPMSDALRRPEFGFVGARRSVIELKSFRASEVAKLNDRRPDTLLVYETAWDPLHVLASRPARWVLRRFYGFEPPLTPDETARALSMQVQQQWTYHGMSMSLLVRDRPRQ